MIMGRVIRRLGLLWSMLLSHNTLLLDIVQKLVSCFLVHGGNNYLEVIQDSSYESTGALKGFYEKNQFHNDW
jgi:hypothetical protein